MGKFDGVLLISDYDDTLFSYKLEVSEANRAAIEYFIAGGGRFSVATGRAHNTFLPQIAKERIPLSAPCVLSNGSAIFDFQADKMLCQTFLCPGTRERAAELVKLVPELGFEAYHGEDIYVHNPNLVTEKHLQRVNVPYRLSAIADMPEPWTKLILQQDHPVLERARQELLSRWGDDYEAIFSNLYLLEVTEKGSNKGEMALKVAEMLHIGRDHLYCVGDNQNDLPMLKAAAVGFAPENCAPEVRAWPGVRMVRHCDDDAVANVVEILDGIYA